MGRVAEVIRCIQLSPFSGLFKRIKLDCCYYYKDYQKIMKAKLEKFEILID